MPSIKLDLKGHASEKRALARGHDYCMQPRNLSPEPGPAHRQIRPDLKALVEAQLSDRLFTRHQKRARKIIY